jgi:hypothetical protein
MCIARAINLENKRSHKSLQACSSPQNPCVFCFNFKNRSVLLHLLPFPLSCLVGPPAILYQPDHTVLCISSHFRSLYLVSFSMIIRNIASKLLGSAIVYSSAPFPPPSDTWYPPCSSTTSVCTSSGELCKLNQSPWDVYPKLHFFRSSFEVRFFLDCASR